MRVIKPVKPVPVACPGQVAATVVAVNKDVAAVGANASETLVVIEGLHRAGQAIEVLSASNAESDGIVDATLR